MKSRMLAAALLAGLCGAAQGAWGQAPLPGTGNVVATTPIAPFAILGYIENMTFAPQAGADLPHAGGTITVNGQQIIIPDNTIVVMPASQVTMYDLFNKRPKVSAADPGGLANGISGLALNDPPPYTPLAPYEVSITGNIVNGRWIAGLVNIAGQEFFQVHQGYITNIDYATGDLCVSGTTPPAGGAPARSGCLPSESRLKINDPVGRFGKSRIDMDPRFAVDDGNPTIRAFTGYPMCVPRINPAIGNDVKCPRNNRPIDPATRLPLTRFVMDTLPLPPVVPGAAPIAGATDIPPCPGCDSTQQVPLMVGDNITYNGPLARDAKGVFIQAWQIVNPVGIFTKPCGSRGTNPITDPTGTLGIGVPTACNPFKDITYMEWEDAEIGTQGTTVDGVFVEGQDRIKVVGATTDPSAQIEIYAITSNPAVPFNPNLVDINGAVLPQPLADGNLRWIANIVPLRIPFGRFTLFVQRDIQKRLPVPQTAGPIPIVSDPILTNAAGFPIDYGATRQIYVHQSLNCKTALAFSGAPVCSGATTKVRPHFVKPVNPPDAPPPFNGYPVPNGVFKADGTQVTIANGLVPAQYFQPVPAYITPENVQWGDPLAPNNFECMDFLVNGWNLPTLSFPNGITMGPLNPWPASGYALVPGGPPSLSVPLDGPHCAAIVVPPGG